jgi:threonine/homoserine/homoserine lactone efflux protein
MSGLDLSLLLSYISVTFLLVITPGATTAVVIRSALAGGTRAGIATAAGAALANSTQALAAGVGLSLLLQRWPSILFALRLGGACYLVWLAFASFRRVWRQPPASPSGVDATDVREGPAFRQGVTVNLLNPPIITFYLVLPTFLRPSAGPAAFAVLAAIHVGMAFAVHSAWALSFARLRELFTRPTARRVLDAGAGIALLSFAVWTFWKI